MLLKVLLITLSSSLFSGTPIAQENPLISNAIEQSPHYSPHNAKQFESITNTPEFEFKQPLLKIKKINKKHKRTAQLQLLNMWIDPDITRLFIPRLRDIGRLSLNLHYSLKRSPYLLLDYEQVTIKTKVKSNGMLQHEVYYNLNIEGAVIGVKVRGEDPLLYFRYRFK